MSTAVLSLASIFHIEAGNYEHFKFDAGSAAFLRNVILGLCAGIIIAALYTMYQRYVPGSFVRAILRAEAFSPETAKNLTELGFEKNIFIRYELRFDTFLLKHVYFTDENNEYAEKSTSKKAPAKDARFYIPEELKYRAELRYETKGSGPVQFILTIALTFGIAALLMKAIPLLLSFLDAIL